jgi:gag-polyprotein putative aspartyl protease
LISCVRREFNATVPAQINQKSFNAIVDSGSQASLLSAKVVEGMCLRPCSVALVDAQGRAIGVSGEIELDITIGSQLVRHVFVVARGLESEVLLGCDFLQLNRCTVDFGSMRLLFNDEAIDIRSLMHSPADSSDRGIFAVTVERRDVADSRDVIDNSRSGRKAADSGIVSSCSDGSMAVVAKAGSMADSSDPMARPKDSSSVDTSR